jgi:hypothetical protein
MNDRTHSPDEALRAAGLDGTAVAAWRAAEPIGLSGFPEDAQR